MQERQTLTLPLSSQPLTAQLQSDQICLWTEVWTFDQPAKEFTIAIVGTGRDLPPGFTYVSTVQQGDFVWHIYYQ